MSDTKHVIERRAALLADAIEHRVNILRDALAPPGKRPPFTKQLSKPAALRWWQLHRYDALGAQVISNMQPVDVMELDLALSQAVKQGESNGIY